MNEKKLWKMSTPTLSPNVRYNYERGQWLFANYEHIPSYLDRENKQGRILRVGKQDINN